MGEGQERAGLECVVGEAACVPHEPQHRLGVGFGCEKAAQGEPRGPQVEDDVEALAAVGGAQSGEGARWKRNK